MENIRQRNIRRPSSVGRVTVMEEIVLSCWVNIVCFCNCKLIFQRFFFKRSIGCRSSGWNYGRNGLQNEPAIWRTYTKGEDNASSDFTKKKTLQQQRQCLPSFAVRQQVSLKFFKYQQLCQLRNFVLVVDDPIWIITVSSSWTKPTNVNSTRTFSLVFWEMYKFICFSHGFI